MIFKSKAPSYYARESYLVNSSIDYTIRESEFLKYLLRSNRGYVLFNTLSTFASNHPKAQSSTNAGFFYWLLHASLSRNSCCAPRSIFNRF